MNNVASASTDPSSLLDSSNDKHAGAVTAGESKDTGLPDSIPNEVLQAAAVPFSPPSSDTPPEVAPETGTVGRQPRRSRIPRSSKASRDVKPDERQDALLTSSVQRSRAAQIEGQSAAAQLSATAAVETARLTTAASANLDSVIQREIANARREYAGRTHDSFPIAAILRHRVTDTLRRFRHKAGQVDPKKFAIAGALVAAATGGALVQGVVGGDRSIIASDQKTGSARAFETIRTIVRASGLFARSVTTSDAGPQYARGAEAADAALLDAWFLAVTDPEARIALLDAKVEHAIATHDMTALTESVGDRIPMIPGQDADRRVDRIRLNAWRVLATEAIAARDHPRAARWRNRATQASIAMQQHGRAVHGHPWSKEVQEALQIGLATVQRNANDHQHDPAYLSGYHAALQEACTAYTLANTLSVTPVASLQCEERQASDAPVPETTVRRRPRI